MDQTLVALAERQYGLVGHSVVGRDGRWLAGVLACGDGALLSHRSAAALWELRPSSSRRVEVVVPRGNRRRSTPEIVVRRATRLDGTVVRGIPVTTPMRTIADLARVLPRADVERALERAETLRVLDVAQLPAHLRRRAERHDFRATRSELERAFLRVCRRHGLPPPLVNTIVHGYEVDFAWPEHRLIVETDGYEHHGTRAAFERDRARDAHLTALGERVIRLTHRQVMRGDAERVIATLAGSAPAPARARRSRSPARRA